MDVSISDIFTALENNNQNTGGAYIDKKPNAYFIRGIGLVTSLEDVGNIVVKNTGSVPVFIKDVAEVQFGHATRYGAMTYNGEVQMWKVLVWNPFGSSLIDLFLCEASHTQSRLLPV